MFSNSFLDGFRAGVAGKGGRSTAVPAQHPPVSGAYDTTNYRLKLEQELAKRYGTPARAMAQLGIDAKLWKMALAEEENEAMTLRNRPRMARDGIAQNPQGRDRGARDEPPPRAATPSEVVRKLVEDQGLQLDDENLDAFIEALRSAVLSERRPATTTDDDDPDNNTAQPPRFPGRPSPGGTMVPIREGASDSRFDPGIARNSGLALDAAQRRELAKIEQRAPNGSGFAKRFPSAMKIGIG